MEDHSVISERSEISYKKTHKRRAKKRNFTFINKEAEETAQGKSGEKKAVEVHLEFSFSKLAFESTKKLRAFKLTKDEKDLLSDLLTDIEQENNLRLYKYLHNILLLALLFIGCALYFTIVVPILCFLFIVYLFCKKRGFKQSIFDKVKESMLEIEEEYNELLERYFVVIFVTNGKEKDIEPVGGKKKKGKKKIKKITKNEQRKKKMEEDLKKKEELELKLTIVKKNINPSAQKNMKVTDPGAEAEGSESSRPLKEYSFPEINISSPSKLALDSKKKSKRAVIIDEEDKGKGDLEAPNKEKAKGEKGGKKEKRDPNKKRKSKSIAKIEADMNAVESEDDMEGFHKVSLNSNLSKGQEEDEKNKKGKIGQEKKEDRLVLEEDVNLNSSKNEDVSVLKKDFQSFSQDIIAGNSNVFNKPKKTPGGQEAPRPDSRKGTANFKDLRSNKTGPSLTPKHKPIDFGFNQRNNKSHSKNEIAKGTIFNDIDPSSRSNMISGFKKNEFTSSFVRENVGSPVVLKKKFKEIVKKKSNFNTEEDKSKLKKLSDIKEENGLRTFGNIGGDSEEFVKVDEDIDSDNRLSQKMDGLGLSNQVFGASKKKIVHGKERKFIAGKDS